jgi:hypothetical protein
MLAPVLICAGLVTPVAVSPRKPGSVASTFCSMKLGSVTPTARSLKNNTSTTICSGMNFASSPMVSSRDVHLVVGARVHEHVRVAFLVQVLHRLGLDVGRLELFTRAQVAFDHAASEQVLELGAREGRALAGLDELELDHRERIAVQHDLESLADV